MTPSPGAVGSGPGPLRGPGEAAERLGLNQRDHGAMDAIDSVRQGSGESKPGELVPH